MTFRIMRIEAETLWGNSRARQKSFILPYKEEIVPNLLRVREYTACTQIGTIIFFYKSTNF